MLPKTRVAIRFHAKKNPHHRLPDILHWYACCADERSVGRSVYGHVLPNFLGWVVYHIFLPMVLHCARFARESSAITTLKILWEETFFNNRVINLYI